MGKYSLLVTLSVATAMSYISFQGEQTSLLTSQQHAERQGQLIARQIARSGYNSVLAKGQKVSDGEKSVEEIISSTGTVRGTFEGGTFRSWLDKVSPSSYRAISVGQVEIAGQEVTYRIGKGYGDAQTIDIPEIDSPSELDVSFDASSAGFCSAVYVERILPETKPEDQPEPDMIFPPGRNRNDAEDVFDKTIQPDTRLNFILAVDRNCSHRGDTSANYPEAYDHVHRSFEKAGSVEGSDLTKIEEAPFGMVEQTTVGSRDGWRVSFEDQGRFSEPQFWDLKNNGYPDSDRGSEWDSEEQTYGGDGWDKNSEDLRELTDYGSTPDFSDQVFKVAVKPSEEEES